MNHQLGKIELPNYIKSLHLDLSAERFADVIAAKFTGKDTIKGYSMLWGNPETADLEAEYFTPQTDFWDKTLGKSARPLTWNHGQDDATFKADPVIGKIENFGDDEVGRWYEATLDRSHKYRKAIDALVNRRKLGTSSDSAPQYVVRERHGKAVWLKQWAWFASALTDVPCEPRMLDVGSPYWKALGITEIESASGVQSADRAREIWLLNARLKTIELED